MFMNQTKKVFPINKILKVELLQDGIALRTGSNVDPVFSIIEQNKMMEAHQIIEQIWDMTPKLISNENDKETVVKKLFYLLLFFYFHFYFRTKMEN
jgi:hypothetical protein